MLTTGGTMDINRHTEASIQVLIKQSDYQSAYTISHQQGKYAYIFAAAVSQNDI